VSPRFGTGVNAFCNHAGQGLWVPAFAGTTAEASLTVARDHRTIPATT
jgi:hypothetical protein